MVLGFADMSLLPPSGSRHNNHAKVAREREKCFLKHEISEEEMKIRREIEREIERDLEEEIKGGIYEQALRLHRLYQHRRKAADINPPEERRKKELLEVNISIKLQRGTKLQIKETKKEAPPPPAESFRPRTSRSDATAARTVLPEVKRLDWVKSLRSGAAPVVVGKNVGCHRSRIPAPGRQ